MNEKEIEKLDKKIALVKECSEYLYKMHEESYNIDYNAFIPSSYDIKKEAKNFEYLKEVLIKLTEKGINVEKKYEIMDNVYLSLNVGGNISFYTYIKDDSWLYDNYICSHSGTNEWLFNTIADAYDLYSGNSSYNYAFGTMTLREFLNYIENKPKDEYSARPHTAEQTANAIEKLIEFFIDKENQTRNAIVKDLEFKFNIMKELVEDKE